MKKIGVIIFSALAASLFFSAGALADCPKGEDSIKVVNSSAEKMFCGIFALDKSRHTNNGWHRVFNIMPGEENAKIFSDLFLNGRYRVVWAESALVRKELSRAEFTIGQGIKGVVIMITSSTEILFSFSTRAE